MLEPLNPDAVAASYSVLLILEVSIPQQFYIQCSKSKSEWATHYECLRRLPSQLFIRLLSAMQ